MCHDDIANSLRLHFFSLLYKQTFATWTDSFSSANLSVFWFIFDWNVSVEISDFIFVLFRAIFFSFRAHFHAAPITAVCLSFRSIPFRLIEPLGIFFTVAHFIGRCMCTQSHSEGELALGRTLLCAFAAKSLAGWASCTSGTHENHDKSHTTR